MFEACIAAASCYNVTIVVLSQQLEHDPAQRMLQGRVAVITGAAGGLGGALVDLFRAEGAEVVPVDLHGVDILHADIATPEGNALMIDAAIERYGRIDTLVLNAGVQYVAPIQEFPLEE